LIGIYERDLRETIREPDAERAAVPNDAGAQELQGTISPGGIIAPEGAIS
jgi:hypothetical protein